jgi:hypothetical protein
MSMAVIFPHTFRDGPGNIASGVQMMDNLNALKTRVDLLDAGLRSSNLDPAAEILDTQLGGNPLSAAWRLLFSASAAVTSVRAGPTYAPTAAGALVSAGSNNQLALPTVTLDGAVSGIPTGRSVQYRLQLLVFTNSVSPGSLSVTMGLNPLTMSGTGASLVQLSPNLGSPAGTVTQVGVTGASAALNALGAPFVASNAFYTFGLAFSSALATDALLMLGCHLHYRYV